MRKVVRAGRELAQLLTGAGTGLLALLLLALTALSLPAAAAAGAGLFLFAGTALLTRRLADRQRRRVAGLTGKMVASSYRPLPASLLGSFRTLVTDPATGRDLIWLLGQCVVGVASGIVGIGVWAAAVQCLAAPLLKTLLPRQSSFDPAVLEFTGRSTPSTWFAVLVGAALLPVAYRLPRHLIAGQNRLAIALLAPSTARRLAARVDELTETRATAVDSSAAELRRLERDLHDGAQMRLVAVAMNLGMAEDVIDDDPAGAKALLAEARANAGEALTELRDLVRGIHPPVLADRGLPGAVRALALAGSVPVALDLRLERRLSASVESTAYFVIAESLTNAIRHSGADQIAVTIDDGGTILRITVRDNGRGGADPARGSGLRGIQSRLSTMDGSLRCDSPFGGPTTLDIELPCAS